MMNDVEIPIRRLITMFYVRFEKCALNASWSHTLSCSREKETLMRFLCTLLMSKCRTAHDRVLESATCSYTEGPTLC